ncbi:Polypyrimidine tract-binding protein 3 [Trichinella spiralis]|uniref:Polypyrimidine tract-binding protein 3 n=1 Tax=Trichinella spiralis TaxID=6334 RepID=A0A0V1AUQ0_TRISP|nr:Polypyrimidine tract-binding protein 3 [Trichinella spiralis]KRY28014.1 Polypyrimidine tract-binding protein 3 [Trichinella spiralis]
MENIEQAPPVLHALFSLFHFGTMSVEVTSMYHQSLRKRAPPDDLTASSDELEMSVKFEGTVVRSNTDAKKPRFGEQQQQEEEEARVVGDEEDDEDDDDNDEHEQDEEEAVSEEVTVSSNQESIFDSCSISRVVHLRNLPSNLTEVELVQHFISYGKIEKVLLLKGKNQGFLQFATITSARALISAVDENPVVIRGKTIFCQYSYHTVLDSQSRFSENKKHFSGLNLSDQEASLVTEQNRGILRGINNTAAVPKRETGGTVLLVVVTNIFYAVTLEVLHQVFVTFGTVLRIIIFHKNNNFQALIQFLDPISAYAAKMALDGKPLINGCCTLKIEFSKLATLNVKYNNEKSRDFTNPNLPSGEVTGQGLRLATVMPAVPAFSPLHASLSPSVAIANPFAPAAVHIARGGISPTNLPISAVSFNTPTNTALQHGRISALQMPQRFSKPPPPLSSVVTVSNLEAEKVTPDALFTLFGVYGDVQRVKILCYNKTVALIQYTEPCQAQQAIHNLDGVCLWGKPMHVSLSKHTSVQLLKEGQSDYGLTKDYSNSTLHRFKTPGSKNYTNIYPPSFRLHLSNIPHSVSGEFIKNIFEQAGFEVKYFRFFATNRKMATVHLESLEQAVEALIKMHNYPLTENGNLRVAFSKPEI